ncbi:MAG: hypothetical protein ACT4NY_16130, partial [Pseudonocardiales bacterium]
AGPGGGVVRGWVERGRSRGLPVPRCITWRHECNTISELDVALRYQPGASNFTRAKRGLAADRAMR